MAFELKVEPDVHLFGQRSRAVGDAERHAVLEALGSVSQSPQDRAYILTLDGVPIPFEATRARVEDEGEPYILTTFGSFNYSPTVTLRTGVGSANLADDQVEPAKRLAVEALLAINHRAEGDAERVQYDGREWRLSDFVGGT